MGIDKNYTELYQNRQNPHAYPNEFAIRTFLGAYPGLPSSLTNTSNYVGKSILDLGCGDGRNMPLFHNCGMKIYGTEVSKDGCTAVMSRMKRLDIPCDVRIGRNNNIPFSDGKFDFVFASGVLSFVDEGDSFRDNLTEPNRVLKEDGLFIFYLVKKKSSQVAKSDQISDGYYRVKNDPFDRINGSIIRAFDNIEEIENEFNPYFTLQSFGESDINIYGYFTMNLWWLICSKNGK